MASITIDHVVEGNIVKHDHSVSDLGAILDTRYLQIPNNLSDLNNASTARANLGLGGLAVLDSLAHSDLTGIGTSDHHTRYADSEAVTALATADVYVQTAGDIMTGDLQTVDLKLSGGDIYPTVDSTTAIQINKADGTTNVLNVDTTNKRIGLGTVSPRQALEIVDGNIRIESTTDTSSGIIYKGSARFIHDFHHPTGDTALPVGRNIFIGELSGNFTMGSTATTTSHASNNMAFGYATLFANTTGYSNMAIGSTALRFNTTGHNNAGVGYKVLYKNTTGNYNICVGNQAMANNINGARNVAIGYLAGAYIISTTINESSDNCVYIGYNAYSGAANSANEIAIGYKVLGLGTNSVVIGNDTITKTVLKGNVGIGTTDPTSKLHIYDTTEATYSPTDAPTPSAKIFKINSAGTDNEYSSLQFRASSNGGTANSQGWISLIQPADGSVSSDFAFTLRGVSGHSEKMRITSNGNVGIGTTSPTNILSLGGESAQIFWMEREVTADTAGNTLTVTAGGATVGATDKAGGALILQGGLSTGSAESGVTIQGCVAGASGTADRTQTTAIQVLGNKLGFFATTPVVQPSAYTPTNVVTDRSYDADATTTAELADVLGTLIADLQGLGLLQ